MSSSSNSSRNNRSHPNRQENDQRNLSKDDNDDSNENQVHIKYLLPGATTGSVIGKGGERIASLQKETNTKIKMSKSGDYFPGTQERVCLVTGRIEDILSVYEFVSEKIKESFPGDLLRSRQIKLIIPNSTAGVIIGKGGTTIENIKQETTASLTITPKTDMAERVLTITGDDRIRIRALEIVLTKILDDPHHDSIPSVNYFNENNSSSLNFNDLPSFNDRNWNGKNNGLLSTNSSNLSIQLSGLQRLSQLIINAGGTNHLTMDSLFHCLSSLGFPDPQIREITQSMNVLINYGLITIDHPFERNYSSPSSYSTYSSSQRDHQENYSRNSVDMDNKRFKSDQQRINKSKR